MQCWSNSTTGLEDTCRVPQRSYVDADAVGSAPKLICPTHLRFGGHTCKYTLVGKLQTIFKHVFATETYGQNRPNHFYHRCGLCDIHPHSQHRCDQLNEYVSCQLCFTQKWFQSRCFISPIGKGKSLYRIGANQSAQRVIITTLH